MNRHKRLYEEDLVKELMMFASLIAFKIAEKSDDFDEQHVMSKVSSSLDDIIEATVNEQCGEGHDEEEDEY